MDAEDEEVDSDIKFKFFLGLEQCEQFHEVLPPSLLEMAEEFLFVVLMVDLVVEEGGLDSSV